MNRLLSWIRSKMGGRDSVLPILLSKYFVNQNIWRERVRFLILSFPDKKEIFEL